MGRKPIMNIDEVEYHDWGDGGKFQARLGPLALKMGARKLGYRMVILPPGKTGWPYHFHHVNEEMFFVLEGEGTLRYADQDYPVRPGDVICCPPGSETPHQLTNTSEQELKYLAVSTMEAPEVAEYPDSGKFGVICGSAPGSDPGQQTFRIFASKSSGVDYWEGES